MANAFKDVFMILHSVVSKNIRLTFLFKGFLLCRMTNITCRNDLIFIVSSLRNRGQSIAGNRRVAGSSGGNNRCGCLPGRPGPPGPVGAKGKDKLT